MWRHELEYDDRLVSCILAYEVVKRASVVRSDDDMPGHTGDRHIRRCADSASAIAYRPLLRIPVLRVCRICESCRPRKYRDAERRGRRASGRLQYNDAEGILGCLSEYVRRVRERDARIRVGLCREGMGDASSSCQCKIDDNDYRNDYRYGDTNKIFTIHSLILTHCCENTFLKL